MGPGMLWGAAAVLLCAGVCRANYFLHDAEVRARLQGHQHLAQQRGKQLGDGHRLELLDPTLELLATLPSRMLQIHKHPELLERLEESLASASSMGCAKDASSFFWSLLSYANATATHCDKKDCVCQNAKSHQLAADSYVLQVVDSWGKLPAAFLSGDTFWLGDFKQCRRIAAVGSWGSFNGQYCRLSLPVNFDLTGAARLADSSCSANKDHQDEGRKLAQTTLLRYGMCVPDSCSASDLSSVLKLFMNGSLSSHISVTCNTPQADELKTDGFAIFMLALLGFFGLLMLIGSGYEHLDYGPRSRAFPEKPSGGEKGRAQFYDELSGFGKALLAFSVLGNAAKLLSVEKRAGQLDCIHGIRFISMTWVILGHTYYFAASYIDNLLDFTEILKELSSQAVLNATVSVDTFFVMSGLLMTYLWLTATAKKDGKNIRNPYHWFLYYVHRYIRLTPVYALVMGLDIGLFQYLTDGPMWRAGGVEVAHCNESWYYNLLYVNNFFGTDQLCFGHAWYLAIDMQMYWVAPVLLITFYYMAPIAIGLLCCLIMMHAVLNGYVEWDWNFAPNAAWSLSPQQFNPDPRVGLWYFKYSYIATYTRCGTYCIGMLFGYALYRIHRRHKSLRFRIPKILNLVVWLVMAVAASWVLYGLWPVSRGDISPKAFNIFYMAVNRLIWGVAVGWVVFACVTGNGGPVNALLSWRMLFPFSRLTYCAYLVHPFCMYLVYQGGDRPIHFDSHYTMVYYFFAHFTMAYALAFVLSLAFESPILTLEKLLLPRDSSGPGPKPSPEKPPKQPMAEPVLELKEVPRMPGSQSEASIHKLGPESPWTRIAFPTSSNGNSGSVRLSSTSDDGSRNDLIRREQGNGNSNEAFHKSDRF